MSVVQYEQDKVIDSADALADSLSSKNNDTLNTLQLHNIGVGLLGFAPISGTTGMLNTNVGFDRINQSLKVILHTVKGEIPMLPKLGSNLDKLLFEPIDDVLDDDIQFAITEAINAFEKRIKVMAVNITHDERVLNKLHVTITYVLTNTNIVHDFEETIYTSNGGVV
jgi:phage baseplate assembly protein W